MSNEDEKPLFLSDEEEGHTPDDGVVRKSIVGKDVSEVTEEDIPEEWILPDSGLHHRHRQLCKYLATGRYTQKKIAEILNITPATVYNLKRKPRIRKEVLKIQDRMFADEFNLRLKDLTHDAIDMVEETLRDDTGAVKLSEKQAMARWLIEKSTGRAIQAHAIEESTLGAVLDALDKIKSNEQADPNTILGKARDVSEGEEAEHKPSALKQWVSEEI